MTLQEKRKRIEELVIGTISRLEKGDSNTKRFKVLFKSMDDKEFEKWANGFKKDSFENVIQLYMEPFEEPRLPEIEKAAEYLGIELDEYIYYRDYCDKPVRSRTKVPVGYVTIKRVQQLLSKKNHYSFDNDERSIKTGQVTGDSKVGGLSGPEVSGLIAVDGVNCVRELLGFRADDAYAKMQAYRQITTQGYIAQDEITINQVEPSQALQTLDTYLICSGFKTDIVNSHLKTRYTIERELKEKNNK